MRLFCKIGLHSWDYRKAWYIIPDSKKDFSNHGYVISEMVCMECGKMLFKAIPVRRNYFKRRDMDMNLHETTSLYKNKSILKEYVFDIPENEQKDIEKVLEHSLKSIGFYDQEIYKVVKALDWGAGRRILDDNAHVTLSDRVLENK